MSKNIEHRGAVWGFWGTFLWGILLFVTFLAGQILPLLLYMMFEGTTIAAEAFDHLLLLVETDASLLFLSTMGGMILTVPIAFGLAKLKRGSILKDYFALNGFKWRTLGFWLVIFIVLQFAISFLIEALGAEEIPNFMLELEYPTLRAKILLLVAVMVAAPVVEEVVFRGFLLKGFANSFMGMHGAVLVTSALWAVIHMQYEIAYLIAIFVIGLLFGYARMVTNSLFIPMIMHSLMNFLAVIGLFYEKGVLG